MTFSVLLAVYAKENPQYLDSALSSVYDHQTLKPGQIVLVKDGPLTEDLDDCINVWKNKLGETLTIVELPENAGAGKARNIGLQQCCHELVAIMDSDDVSLPDRFKKQIEFYNLNPDVALCSGYINEFKNEPDDMYSVRKVPLDNCTIVKKLKVRNTFNQVAVMFKKSAILSVGGYDALPYFEDYDLWIRVVQAKYMVGNIPEILVNVRTGNDMISRRHGLMYAKSELFFLKLQKTRGFISNGEYFLLVLSRIPFRFIPKKLLILVYRLLRHNKTKIEK